MELDSMKEPLLPRSKSAPPNRMKPNINVTIPPTTKYHILNLSGQHRTLDNSHIPETLDNCDIPETLDNSDIPETLDNSDIPETLDNSDIPETLDNSDIPEIHGAPDDSESTSLLDAPTIINGYGSLERRSGEHEGGGASGSSQDTSLAIDPDLLIPKSPLQLAFQNDVFPEMSTTPELRQRSVNTDPQLSPKKGPPRDSKKGPEKVSKLDECMARIKTDRNMKIFRNVKIAILFLGTFICTVIFAINPEFDLYNHQYSVSIFDHATLNATKISRSNPIVSMYLTASFVVGVPSKKTQNITVRAINPVTNTTYEQKWVIASQKDLVRIDETQVGHRFDFSNEPVNSYIILEIRSSTIYSVPLSIGYIFQSTEVYKETIYASIILFFVYILIIFDLVHRALAAMLGSLAALAVMAVLSIKPPLEEVLTWLDYDTLCLLFGMMLLVSIFTETGFFDWLALQMYKLAQGKTWPLITLLCLCSAVTSAFLDNVTTILLLAPVTIRLCEVKDLDPKHVLMAEVLFSNIGGISTAIGDPPNVIIVGSAAIEEASEGKVNFATFTVHMLVGSIFTLIAAYILLRFMYRRKDLLQTKDPPNIFEMKIEIAIWKRQMRRIAVASREGAMVKLLLQQKIKDMQRMLKEKREEFRTLMVADFQTQVKELEKTYVIKDYILLGKCGFVVSVVIIVFFIHSFVPQIHVSIGWIAMLGAIWLLVLSDQADFESVLHRIEWSTLLFFAALFVLMEALTRLNLMDFIADQASSLIRQVDEDQRLTVAIIVILWVSAVASSLIDNIPFTTAMVPVIVKLADDPSLGLPLDPLVWSLAFGACLGGNGTLIGASCNVVCAGLAEANGHSFSFWEFFKVGAPTMVVTVFIAMCYLLLCHVVFDWTIF